MLDFRTLSEAELPAILALQQVVVDDLEDKRVLQPLSEAEFLNIVSGNGLMIGVYEAGQLVAFRALLKPDTAEAEH